MQHQSRPVPQFPAAWPWLVDEAIPTWVKKKYSPRESWKDKPFENPDANFFMRGIQELSDLFTDERPGRLPDYFLQPRFRSSYLLYFLPLQAAKFVTLFRMHSAAIDAALHHAKKQGVLRVLDLGTGPGTASIALLLELLDRKTQADPILPVELYWFDTNAKVMADGKALVELITNNFPGLRGKVKLHARPEPWWKATHFLKEPVSLALIGHVLNESSGDSAPRLEEVLTRVEGGGTLIVEPAARRPSQSLTQIRDVLLESRPHAFWGPCLHGGRCPLSNGRDWCHFSLPVDVPGKWFRTFSKKLGSERHWLKFSYIWIAAPGHLPKAAPPQQRRVVSDPMKSTTGGPMSVLLCEPDEIGRMDLPPIGAKIFRGDLVTLPSEKSKPKTR